MSNRKLNVEAAVKALNEVSNDTLFTVYNMAAKRYNMLLLHKTKDFDTLYKDKRPSQIASMIADDFTICSPYFVENDNNMLESIFDIHDDGLYMRRVAEFVVGHLDEAKDNFAGDDFRKFCKVFVAEYQDFIFKDANAQAFIDRIITTPWEDCK